ncbi:AAA domain-containing protein [Desulfofundulus thermobenzoicus]|uniref:AAA domain-containing protein n=1 Tax=Desulfofundulus thermobenzoicus TaxID=29376 RepID=A0A6N7IRA8_9FIRM|nr:sigma 54-interacting transcriptional regulator [Desulfofundulus thermobenzoicus]MQL52059.1 AAA domain-containing protein [Desulfofundulus thermobenzoicus]
MRGLKIALIAPYDELSRLASEVCVELGENIAIATGDLVEGVSVAKQFIEQGMEVLISRGGTATAIRASVNVPVVEIAISGFDIIRAINQARRKGRKIGVVGFKNVIYGSKSLAEILDVEIHELVIGSSSEAQEAIKEARDQRVDVLVGDVVATRMAREYGLESVLITSGKEAISQAIREAHEIGAVRQQERARAEQLKTILEFAFEGIVAVDQQGYINLMNPEAEKLLQLDRDQVIGKQAAYVLPEIPFKEVLEFGRIRFGDLSRINGNLLVHNVVPVIISNQTMGAVATIQDIKHIQAVEEKARKEQYAKGLVAHYSLADIVTTSPLVQEVINKAQKFARVDSTILIHGETGTGKELFAQGIHNASQRKKGPFVAVNCAALTESILESELFGYEEGAFTGAKKGGKKGLFELAHGGTIFLDEIGELSPNIQARLLRVLQEKEIMRVGGDKVIPVDVRIIAATHRDLQELIRQDKFRRDLYYRLSTLILNIPPLRERLEDIPVLVRVLCRDLAGKLQLKPPEFSHEAIKMLKQYTWPGNIRELKNLLERVVVLKNGGTVEAADIDKLIDNGSPGSAFISLSGPVKLTGTLAEIEEQLILEAVKRSRNREEAAKKLGISTTTLWRKLKMISH